MGFLDENRRVVLIPFGSTSITLEQQLDCYRANAALTRLIFLLWQQ